MPNFLHASLAADRLSLGPHWIYNPSKLARLYPNGVFSETDPSSQYHPERRAGDQTHYGDQTLWLRDSIAAHGGFNPDQWRTDWLQGMSGYGGYIDGASSATREAAGKQPGDSNDLAGASRIAPLLELDLPLEEAVQAARAQTALTHGDPGVADAAEFFVRASRAVEGGASIPDALAQAAAEGNYPALDVASAIQVASEAASRPFTEVSAEMGLTCHLPEAFPLTLYFLLRPHAEFRTAISDNALAGGDSAARAMLMALVFAARSDAGTVPAAHVEAGSHAFEIDGPHGTLAGVLELPEGTPRGYALFAHCFTCGKDFAPGSRIARALASEGIATVRIDFAGIGTSAGEFSNTSFVTNVEDLLATAEWMRTHHQAPALLIGHSLGGAAVLAATPRIAEVRAVVTIGAPSDPEHVTHLFADHVESIERDGQAEVQLAGRPFVVGKRFLDDLREHQHADALGKLRGVEALILHAPDDAVVPLENAGEIYSALRHPKSFVSLTGADHLLTRKADAEFVAQLVEVWSRRVLDGAAG